MLFSPLGHLAVERDHFNFTKNNDEEIKQYGFFPCEQLLILVCSIITVSTKCIQNADLCFLKVYTVVPFNPLVHK